MPQALIPSDNKTSAWLRLTGLCGAVVIALGATVLLGWHIQNVVLTQIRPQFVAMQYLTAICLVLGGAGLVAFSVRWPRVLTAVPGSVLGLVGLLLCVEYLTGVRLGFDLLLAHFPTLPGEVALRPSPPTALCFLLCGTAIVLLAANPASSLRRLSLWVLGSLALAICLMALCGYMTGLAGTYEWGPFLGMAVHTAAAIAILSVGLLVTLLHGNKPLLEDKWLPVPVAVVMITATLVLWQALVSARHQTARTRSVLVAKDVENNVLGGMKSLLRALERMKLRWDARGGTPFEEWKKDASAYLLDEKPLVAIQWADASLHVRWVIPESDLPKVGGLDLKSGVRWNATRDLERSQANREMVMSPNVPLKQGGQGFLVYYPLYAKEKFDGFLIGVFRFHTLIESIMGGRAFEDYSISVFEDDELVFGPAQPSGSREALSVESSADFYGHRWRFVVQPRDSANSISEKQLPNVVLLLGLLLGAAVTTAVHGLQRKQREVSERHRIEARLRDSEDRLRAVLDSATGVSVIATDPAGLITYFSKGAEELLGYSAGEMIGKLSPAIFHDPNEVAARGAELSRELGHSVTGFETFVCIARQRGSERREWTYICKDGSRLAVDLTVTVLSDESGAIRGFLGTALDVTRSKELEQALRESLRAKEAAQDLLEAAGHIARLGHWELPLDGSGPTWSTVTYEIHEVEPGTPISLEQAFAFFHPDDRSAIEDTVRHSMETGEVFEFETRLITARNGEVWVHTMGEPTKDESGKVVALHGVFQDVDERHRAAALLAERNQQLEAATAEALAYAKAKAEFLANMSHEIRTPLNAIIGMSDLLHDTVVDGRQKEFVDTIRTGGDVLLTLINDILDFSKIEAGKLELEHLPVNLQECIETSLDLVSSQASRKELDLLYWMDPEVPPFVLGDVTRLRQILVNLVSNGVKFTNEGEVVVRVTKKPREGEGVLLQFSVRDTGIGIPEEQQQRLFKAFSQIDASTTRRYGGTGLGLAICQRLVSMMHGRIWVKCPPGRGADFRFEILFEASTMQMAETPEPGVASDLKGLRLLVVDDNETNRWILREQAAGWGMQTHDTGHPSEALAWVTRGDNFDLAILDVHMPEMDGYELAAKLREHKTEQELPLLMLTSKADNPGARRELGIREHLTKPVRKNGLFAAIAKLISGRRAFRPAPASLQASSQADECPLNILVAEDNSVNQRVIKLLLERLGYRPDVVANGLEVLNIMRLKSFDVILMDVQMPEMDGREATREICRLYEKAERPLIIALTADAGEDDRARCLDAGMDDFLSKPVRAAQIETLLRKVFKMRKKTSQ